MDTLSFFELLSLPSGAQLVSDHGAVTLLLVMHDGPEKVTLERVALGSPVSLLDVIQAAQQRGMELFTPTVTVLAKKPKESASEQPKVGIAKGFQFPKVPCSQCGKLIGENQIKKHEAKHDRKSQAAAPAPLEPEPEPEPEPEMEAPQRSYEPDVEPDYLFRDELLGALQRAERMAA